MKFYRNLGVITYQCETPSFQIFNAQPATTIFQLKNTPTNTIILDQFVTLYNHHYNHSQLLNYSEPQKASSLLLKHSKKADLRNIDTQKVCSLLVEVASLVMKMGQGLEEWVGECTIQQFRQVRDRVVFVYIPLTKLDSVLEKKRILVEQVISLAKSLINDHEISQKLLIKKISKCKSLDELIEEINYFSSVYCIGKIKNNQTRPLILPCSKGYRNIRQKSNRKSNLFKLDISKHKKYQHSSDTINYSTVSEHRQSYHTIHVSVSQKKFSNSSRIKGDFRKGSLNKEKKVNLSCSRIIEDQEEGKGKSIKRESRKGQQTSNYSKLFDDSKLLQKLRSRKKLDTQQHQQKQIKTPVKKVNISMGTSLKLIQRETQTITTWKHIQKQKQKTHTIQKIQQSQDDIKIIKKSPFNELKSNNSVKRQSVELFAALQKKEDKKEKEKEKEKVKEKVDGTVKSNTLKKDNVYDKCNSEENFNKKIKQNLKKPNATPVLLGKKDEVSSTLVKKSIKKKCLQQQFGSEIQIIDLGGGKTADDQKQKDVTSKEPQNDMEETLKQPWNVDKKDKAFNQTSKMSFSQKLRLQIVKKKNELNLMGTAVGNTAGYLVGYDKIFWELPLYFIYRGFYMKRLQLAKQAEHLRHQFPNECEQISKQNDKIKDSVSKLTKKVAIRVKRDRSDLYQTIKPVLNLDEEVNCTQIMKGFLKQYIQSLSKAVNKDENLLVHLLQIVDAYLIYYNVKINQPKRQQAKKTNNLKEYIKQQNTKLNQYL